MSRFAAPVPGSLRTMTITKHRYRLLFRGLLLDALASSTSVTRFLYAAFLALLCWGLSGRWVVGVVVTAAAVVVIVTHWCVRIRAGLRSGLAIGQTVTTGYTAWGELTVTDVTGTLCLGRGSAASVTRTRDRVIAWLRTTSFVLPTELLTDDDIAFLEGAGEAPAPSAVPVPVPVLPLELVVTEQVQARVMAAAVRVRARSADVLFPLLTPALLLALTALTRSRIVALAAGFFLLVCIGIYLEARHAARTTSLANYPVGATIRASVTPDHLVLQSRGGTVHSRWSEFVSRRLTSDAVLLRRDRRRPETTVVLPRELFSERALADLATAVPRSY